MPSEPSVPSPLRQLLAVFPAPVQTLARSARDFVLAALPDAVEIPAKAKVIGYGYGPGYKHMVATLILSKGGVKIGLVQGASLPDPAALLKGAGKVHRYIDISTRDQLLTRLRCRRSLAYGCKGKLSQFDARKRPAGSGGLGSI
jgi:hypothetical protein